MKGVGALASLTGPSATVAHANIQKNQRRIAATGAALLIGVTLVSTIATGAASAKETMNGALATRYSVDIVAMGDDISQQMVKDVADINGVSDTLYAPAVSVTLEKADGTQPTSALLVGVKNIDQVKQVMRANLGNASIDSDGVLMPTYNAQTGKELQFANGTADFSTEWNQDGDATRSLTLQANQADYRRVSAQYGAVGFVDESHFTNGDLDAATHVLLVKADTDKSGVSVDGIYNDMQAALEKSTDATVTGPIAERIVWAKMIDSMMMLLVGLIAVAVLIALVGVANTLSLSVIERTRESATLRAIGMTRGQLRASLAIEALLISLVSGIAASCSAHCSVGWAHTWCSVCTAPWCSLRMASTALCLPWRLWQRCWPASHLPVGRSGCRQLRRSQKLSTSTGGLRGKPLTHLRKPTRLPALRFGLSRRSLKLRR